MIRLASSHGEKEEGAHSHVHGHVADLLDVLLYVCPGQIAVEGQKAVGLVTSPSPFQSIEAPHQRKLRDDQQRRFYGRVLEKVFDEELARSPLHLESQRGSVVTLLRADVDLARLSASEIELPSVQLCVLFESHNQELPGMRHGR